MRWKSIRPPIRQKTASSPTAGRWFLLEQQSVCFWESSLCLLFHLYRSRRMLIPNKLPHVSLQNNPFLHFYPGSILKGISAKAVWIAPSGVNSLSKRITVRLVLVNKTESSKNKAEQLNERPRLLSKRYIALFMEYKSYIWEEKCQNMGKGISFICI